MRKSGLLAVMTLFLLCCIDGRVQARVLKDLTTEDPSIIPAAVPGA